MQHSLINRGTLRHWQWQGVTRLEAIRRLRASGLTYREAFLKTRDLWGWDPSLETATGRIR